MEKADKRKIVLIGTGMVGMSYAYALLNQNLCDELVLIDINKKRAEGEAMDLNHGVAFSGGNMEIYAGEYTDCCNADLVVLTAGLPQKEGQNRLDLLKENRKIFERILQSVLENGFHGIFLVATNPVDIMTRIVYEISDFPPEKVIGTGTALDTARLRYLLGEKFMIDPRNMHAYVMGEHGDSEFVPWSQAMMATKPIFDLCGETEGCHFQELLELEEEVRKLNAENNNNKDKYEKEIELLKNTQNKKIDDIKLENKMKLEEKEKDFENRLEFEKEKIQLEVEKINSKYKLLEIKYNELK